MTARLISSSTISIFGKRGIFQFELSTALGASSSFLRSNKGSGDTREKVVNPRKDLIVRSESVALLDQSWDSGGEYVRVHVTSYIHAGCTL